ncbi:hypothetical protein BGX27_002291 [Mortierella sp. AM989]|nr:hypothetical protein BGX27_002291 [Mortierella sp. AM989]
MSNAPLSARTLYLAWANDKKPKKEHVSLPNFVSKFDITDKESANESFLSLISSKRLRKARRNKLQNAFEIFRKRHEKIFWERRALGVADKRLLTNSATVAEETAVIARNASIKETISGFERYQSNLMMSEDYYEGIIDDTDSDNSDNSDDSEDSEDSDTESERQAEISPAHESDVDTAADDLESSPDTQIVTPSGVKATPFYDLIAYFFLKVKNKSAILPPLILDMQGARAYIYTIKKFGDVYGAGSVTDRTIRLPTSDWELFALLGRPDLNLLLKVVDGGPQSGRTGAPPHHDQHLVSARGTGQPECCDGAQQEGQHGACIICQFRKKFDLTKKDIAKNSYESLIKSQHINLKRQRELDKAYKAFQERSWDSFWSRRDLMIAGRALQVNSATVAKKMGVEAQNAGFKEGRLGFR